MNKVSCKRYDTLDKKWDVIKEYLPGQEGK